MRQVTCYNRYPEGVSLSSQSKSSSTTYTQRARVRRLALALALPFALSSCPPLLLLLLKVAQLVYFPQLRAYPQDR